MHESTEGGARFTADVRAIASADMEVFYNPLMRENRDMSLLVLSWLLASRSPRRLVFPMAASGVRPLRMLEELDVPECEVLINDADPRAVASARSSLELNERASSWNGAIRFSRSSAQELLSTTHADYVEIDPYGSPLPFLDAAIRCVTHRGILAVTATDTAALCGTYPKTGLRKYHAFTKRNPLMHEHAVRILAAVVERDAARYGKAARIVFAYAHLHYIKLFFEVTTSRSHAYRLVSEAEYWDVDATGYPIERRILAQGRGEGMIGPLSPQPLVDPSLIEHAATTKAQLSERSRRSLELIGSEGPGYTIDLHALASELELSSVPKTSLVLGRLPGATRTQFSDTAIRTSLPRTQVCEAMR